ncbi:MAG: ABC transporter permease [Dehalococcoidia bacterium]|nr:ABC transporter permease [Dehalococcoidia bacterium]MYK26827.1 ABC transporter permease [Dehalococcoidia bacterium]
MARPEDSVLVTESTALATDEADASTLTARPSAWRRLGQLARSQPVGVFGLFLTLVVVVIVIFGPYLATHEPDAETTNLLASPSGEHWFGTDLKGRDYFSRTLAGGRITVVLAVAALALGTAAGTLIGMASAYVKILDLLLQRLIDAILALPGLFLILLFITVFGKDVEILIYVVALSVTPALVRIARAATLSTLTNPYVEAAEVVGASGIRILLRHVLPNIAPTIGTIFAVGVGNLMLVTGTLGFLGLGVQPPQSEWGQMIADSRQYVASASHLFIFPSIGLALAVLGVNLLGDSLRDLWDPRLRGT